MFALHSKITHALRTGATKGLEQPHNSPQGMAGTTQPMMARGTHNLALKGAHNEGKRKGAQQQHWSGGVTRGSAAMRGMTVQAAAAA